MMRINRHRLDFFLLPFFMLLFTGCLSAEQRANLYVMDNHISVDTPEFIKTPITEPPLSEDFVIGDTVKLTIEQTVMLTLKNNRDLKVNQLQPIIAGTFEQIERGAYDPEWFVQATYFKEKSTETSRATGEQFGVKGAETDSVVGLRQELPTGTSFEATLSHNRETSDRAPDQQTARIGLSITQSLLRGFGAAVNLADIRQAELGVSASIYELRAYVEMLLAESEIAYWQYVLAEKEIVIYESSLAVVKRQRDEIENKIDVGLLAETEAAAARAQVAAHEQALIDARSFLEERRLQLLKKISLEADGRFDLKINAVSDPFVPDEPKKNLSQRILLADQFRPDVNEARLRLEQNRLRTVVSANGLLPELDFFVDLGRTGFADNFSGAFRELDNNTYDYTAGVSLRGLIGNRVAKAGDYATRISYQQTVDAVANLRQIIELEVRLAVNEVERTWQQISASKATRLLEEEKLKAEKERFEVGAGTSLLVAQAQRDLLISRIAEVRAVIKYRIALVKLYLAEGSLLERRGVSVN